MSSARANAAARQRRAEPQTPAVQPNQSLRQIPAQTQVSQLTPQQIQYQQQQRIYQQQAEMQQMQQMQQGPQMQQGSQMQQGPQMQQGSQMQQGQQIQQSKMSISDAIALTTLRLGRVESIVQGLQNSMSVKSDDVGSDNSLLVDLQARLNLLESWQKFAEKSMSSIQNLKLSENSLNENVSNESEIISMLKSEINVLKNELNETKNLLMNLQSFTMQTNQKLVDVVFNDYNNVAENTHQFNFVSMDSLSDVFTKMKSSSSELDVTELEDQHVEPNLKEIIEKELNNL